LFGLYNLKQNFNKLYIILIGSLKFDGDSHIYAIRDKI